MMLQFLKNIILSLAILWPLQSAAHDYEVGDIIVDHPVMREAMGAVSGGYMVIENTGDEADRLIAISATFATRAEIHETTMKNDVMSMAPLQDGLVLPAGETIRLKPGGNHLMFMGLTEPMERGDKHSVTLTFEKAGDVDVVFHVKSIAATMNMQH